MLKGIKKLCQSDPLPGSQLMQKLARLRYAYMWAGHNVLSTRNSHSTRPGGREFIYSFVHIHMLRQSSHRVALVARTAGATAIRRQAGPAPLTVACRASSDSTSSEPSSSPSDKAIELVKDPYAYGAFAIGHFGTGLVSVAATYVLSDVVCSLFFLVWVAPAEFVDLLPLLCTAVL
jgi:hypothetical protein